MSDIAAFFRLLGALWMLVRADALLPEGLDPYLPPDARLLAKVLRLFRGPQARRGRPGERLALALERLGPVSIKLGQLLSTRADIFGQVFADDLARLKDQLEPFPMEQAYAEVSKSLGRPAGQATWRPRRRPAPWGKARADPSAGRGRRRIPGRRCPRESTAAGRA